MIFKIFNGIYYIFNSPILPLLILRVENLVNCNLQKLIDLLHTYFVSKSKINRSNKVSNIAYNNILSKINQIKIIIRLKIKKSGDKKSLKLLIFNLILI